MKGLKLFAPVLLAIILVVIPAAGGDDSAGRIRGPQAGTGHPVLTILYDNTTDRADLKPDWGFAALIEGLGKTILFDTGTKPEILVHNCRVLGVDLARVEILIISHPHGDHTGGIMTVLKKSPRLKAYIPGVAENPLPPQSGLDRSAIAAEGAEVVLVKEPIEVIPGVYLTGQMIGAAPIPEVSVILDSGHGVTLLTGCAHPGIVEITQKAAALRGQPVGCVLGGFHLMSTPEAKVKDIIAKLKGLGAVKCGATHCTGEAAIAVFKKEFGEAFITLGVGRKLTL